MSAGRIVVLGGDGIGPEVTGAAVEVLRAVGDFDVEERPIGAAAIERHGVPLPEPTLSACAAADAVLLGAVGDGRQPTDPGVPRPEQGVLDLRAALGLYANLRPVRAVPALRDASPLRPERLAGVDLVVVRELTGGLYFGRRGRSGHGAGRRAFDTCAYTAEEVERVARLAFELARERAAGRDREPRLVSVDKANVLDTSRLWREIVQEVADRAYRDVRLEHVLVDTAAMRLVTEPGRFDVVLTENMFGDILSDETAAIVGSLGLAPSASLPAAPGPGGVRGGLFEPVHGSAPDIAGKGVANPVAAILSVAMLLRYGLGLSDAATALESAVDRTLERGIRTEDLGGSASTADVVREVLSTLCAETNPIT